MRFIDLNSVLDEEQFYVSEIGSFLGVDIKAVKHEKDTDTCFEKADLLNWPSERVVKSVFFRKNSDLYGFVFPELGTLDKPLYLDKKNLGNILGYTKNQAKRLNNSYCPTGMEYGTCTPFVFESSFDGGEMAFGVDLKKIYVHDFSNSLPVDISIGGLGKEAHQTSLHLPYNSIYEILKFKFKDSIEKVDFFKNI